MSGSIKIWLQAFRLQTLPLALANSVLGSLMAYSAHGFRWSVFVLVLLTTLFLQILSNLANDFGDAKKGTDNTERLGPQRVTQTGLVSYKAIKLMIVVFVLLSFFSGVALIFVGLNQLPAYTIALFFFLGLTAIFAAIKYTVGKNPYGYSGFGDVFVFLFFGLVGVCGTFYLHTSYLDLWVLLPAGSIGLLSVGVLNLNNMRDIDNDAKSGKKTIVVRMGIKAAKVYHLALIFVALVLSGVYTYVFYTSLVQLAFLLTIPLFILNIKTVWQNTIPVELNSELKKLALSTFAFSVSFGVGLILA